MRHSLLDKRIYRKFTRLYIIALTAVAFLSIIGQLLVQQMLNDQSSDSWIINYAGRQRFQSQAIAKSALILVSQSTAENRDIYHKDLVRWLQSWTRYHYALKSGNLADLHTLVKNSAIIQAMFADIEPHFMAMQRSARQILSEAEHPTRLSEARNTAAMQLLLEHERPFLQMMDKIVAQYEAEAHEKVTRLRRIEWVLLVATILVLLLEALLVFRPAVSKLRQTILALIEAEHQAREMNEELKSLNQSLEETREELLAATQEKYAREIEDQRIRISYMIQGQEEERKRLARDLHDDLGQMLTALKLGIENLTDSAEWSPKGKKKLAEIKHLVGQTIQEVRNVSFNLMPSVLNDFGVTSALRLLTGQVSSSTDAKVLFQTNLSEERFAKEIEVSLYRMGQESLNNAIKYADADTIKVELTFRRKHLHLKVVDDGVGFNYADSKKKQQQDHVYHGLMHIQERARLINGEVAVQSDIGKGTTVHITIPAQPLK